MLILASIFMMYRDYSLARENYETLERLSSTSGAAVIPPTPLSIFVKGLDDNLCRSYDKGVNIEVSSKQQSVNKVFRLFTTPDLLYVIKVVLSLCAMLFAFDMICGEKEAGTLCQSLSSSLGRPILILGKWIGGFTSFVVPLFIAVLLGTTFVALQPTVALSPQDWARLGLFLLSSVIYLAVFFSLGLLISCLTHQASSALVVSLSVWTLLVFLIPNLGNILARELVEIPTVQQLEVARTHNFVRLYLAERTMGNTDRSELDRLVDRVRAESDQLAEDYRNRFNRLLAVSQNITRMSPAAAFTFLATDIMGTGVAEERRLKSAVLQYIHTMRKWSGPTDSRPAFRYERSRCGETLAQAGLGNLLILLLFGILLGTGAYVAFLRYDVR
jgi:ABC-type transport system involved in multi-copper enzyme maturation permease subunit